MNKKYALFMAGISLASLGLSGCGDSNELPSRVESEKIGSDQTASTNTNLPSLVNWTYKSDRDNVNVSTRTWASLDDSRVQEIDRFLATATDGHLDDLPYAIVRTDNSKASAPTSVRSIKVTDVTYKGHDMYPAWAIINKVCLELMEGPAPAPNEIDLVLMCQDLQNRYVAESAPVVAGEIKEQIFVSASRIENTPLNIYFDINGQQKEADNL